MVQTITAVEAYTAARKAYNEGRLLAQCTAVDPDMLPYGYEVDVGGTSFVCGIGAGLSRDSLDRIEEDSRQLTTIVEMTELSYIFDCPAADFVGLHKLQDAHDTWLMCRINAHEEEVEDAKRGFLGLIESVLGEDDA